MKPIFNSGYSEELIAKSSESRWKASALLSFLSVFLFVACPASNQEEEIAAPATPEAPTVSSVSRDTSTGNTIALGWTDESGADFFEMHRSKSPSTGYKTVEKKATEMTYTDSGLEAGTTYYYKIKACYNPDICSELSNYVSAITAHPVPAIPGKPSAQAEDTSISLSWILVEGADSYMIEKSIGNQNSFAPLRTLVGDSYVDGQLTPSTTYYYKIAACHNSSGCSDFSAVLSVTTKPPALTAPTEIPSVAATAQGTSIALDWQDVTKATYYKIKKSTTNFEADYLPLPTEPQASDYVDSGLNYATYYNYKVAACNSKGCSNFSNPATALTDDAPVPAMPNGFTAVAGSEKITLTWTSNGADHYKLHRSLTENANDLQVIIDNLTGATHTDLGLTAGVTYYYKIQACNSFDACSNLTSAVSAIAGDPPVVPPTELPALSAQAISTSEIYLNWLTVNTATFYEVYKKNAQNIFELIETNLVGLEYNDKSLSHSTTYNYQVKACNSAGCSVSNNAAATTQTPPTPGIPTLSAQTLSDTSISLAWDSPQYATSFNVQKSLNGIDFTSLLSDTTATSYLHSSLSASTAYYYKINACNQDVCSAYSDIVSAKTVANGVTVIIDDDNNRINPAFKLPDTDQTRQVTAGSYVGEDSAYSRNPKSYTDNGDGTITDNNTGLVWEKLALPTDHQLMSHSAAIDKCIDQNTVANEGWHLPSVKELATLLDFSQASGSKIEQSYFPNTPQSDFWVSDSSVQDGLKAWKVNFSSGLIQSNSKTNSYYVRCVINKYPVPSFVLNPDGTVTDQNTGLVWLKEAQVTYIWEYGPTLCEDLVLHNASDWRMPNYLELVSISDYIESLGINNLFENNEFWSSTLNLQSSAFIFNGGYMDSLIRTASGGLTCVRR